MMSVQVLLRGRRVCPGVRTFSPNLPLCFPWSLLWWVSVQVLLKTAEGVPLAYAASWWAEYEARMHLSEAHTPIWVALQQQRMELFRSLECLYYGHSREIER